MAQHRVDALATAFGGRVADLRVLREVVEVAVDQECVDGRLLAERVNRVLVGRRQQRLADVEQNSSMSGFCSAIAGSEPVAPPVTVASTERDHLERTLTTDLDHTAGQLVEGVLARYVVTNPGSLHIAT